MCHRGVSTLTCSQWQWWVLGFCLAVPRDEAVSSSCSAGLGSAYLTGLQAPSCGLRYGCLGPSDDLMSCLDGEVWSLLVAHRGGETCHNLPRKNL
jgi:hypothetical protein